MADLWLTIVDFFLNGQPWMASPFFMIWDMVLFAIMGTLALKFAITTRNNPEKKGNPRFFINEIMLAILFYVLVVLYPFIFNNGIPDQYTRYVVYFHMWDSLNVNALIWIIISRYWKHSLKKHNRFPTYKSWTDNIEKGYKDNATTDFFRKLMHVVPASITIILYALGVILEPYIAPYAIGTPTTFAVFFIVAVGLGFLFALFLLDYLRLTHFGVLGALAQDGLAKRLRPSEFYTFTTAIPMIVSIVPFIMAPAQLLFIVALITSIADASASIVGKRFGKIREGGHEKKTREGFIAGFVATYLIVVLVCVFVPLPNPSFLLINTVALITALAFVGVDKYSRYLSDNFLNPLICGFTLMISYALLSPIIIF